MSKMKKETIEKICELMREKGMKQKDLAKKIGVNEVTLSRYLNGTRCPRADIFLRIAEALETTTDVLMGYSKEQSDFDLLIRIVKKCVPLMSPKEKADIVQALFDDE